MTLLAGTLEESCLTMKAYDPTVTHVLTSEGTLAAAVSRQSVWFSHLGCGPNDSLRNLVAGIEVVTDPICIGDFALFFGDRESLDVFLKEVKQAMSMEPSTTWDDVIAMVRLKLTGQL